MTPIANRLAAVLPAWARPDHPLLRYELERSGRLTRRARLARGLWLALLIAALLLAGVLIATDFLRQPAGLSLTESVAAALYWPLLTAALALGVAVIFMTGGSIAAARRRQTWDSLRATAGGAELALRAQWVLVFYRLRGPLGVVLLLRALLVGGMLFDLTAFQGRYLDLLISGVAPPVPLPLAALLLACAMTAGLLLPVTSVGFDAAVGLWISAAFQTRIYAVMAQTLVALARLALIAGLAAAASAFIAGNLAALPDPAAWALLLAFGAAGDQGLAFLNLSLFGEVWAVVPYGILLGPALLALALAQAAIGDWVLARAVRRAERTG
ncbi:MAG: hypothetical protein ACUVSX_11865 [Aggregatilineales bacterium]